ncbi:MAG: 16S rRNA (uracil(1498)-N(3))-methyltransferase [Spirochaetaceae bacterium]|nr:MAG: 16S rRNA (uracil(1498)-N(3))-methyltransferase [Spirochaetaceae bacterium]
MRTLILPPECSGEGRHRLTGKPFHHLCHVRRTAAGSVLDAIDEHGGRYEVVVVAVHAAFCEIDVFPAPRRDEPTLPRLVLYQGLPKGRKLDQIIRQCTEAGIDEIRPFVSRYTVVETRGDERGARKRERWAAVAREAVQQSGRGTVPRIFEPVPLDGIPAIGEPDSVGLLFHEAPLAQAALHEYLTGSPQTVAMVVGGEGGLAPDEVDFLIGEAGYRPVFLGPTVLRTETAAIYALAAVRTILREKPTWSSD